MSMKIKFDTAHNPESPTIILAKKNGDKIGLIKAHDIDCSCSMNNANELMFTVYKYENGNKTPYWDEITDFKLAYCVEYNQWFEIHIETDESNNVSKTVNCVGLGYAELSQIMLYNIEINTEIDIAREDYTSPTVLYDPDNPSASLLNRIMEKASHYKIKHVDDSIKDIQRTFSFDDTSLTDAFNEIADEMQCLFSLDVTSDSNGKIQREISVYDLQSVCYNCGNRGEFIDSCPKCGSDNINDGYGYDTNIFISSDDIAENVNMQVDVDSVKNCFKLEAGDDLMTAVVRSCNPNGSDYLWYITDDMRHDMSDGLVSKLQQYDESYKYYQDEYIVMQESDELLDNYNELVDKYKQYEENISNINAPIIGYQSLMNAYYDTIDFELLLRSGLMPTVEIPETSAEKEAEKLTQQSLSPVAVEKIESVSKATADGTVMSIAKIIVDSSRYKVSVIDSSIEDSIKEEEVYGTSRSSAIKIWKGSFNVTSYTDEKDSADTDIITIEINDDYELFVKQKIDKQLNKIDDDSFSIEALFNMELEEFINELKKYSLNRLMSFKDACQTCIEILIEQGIGDKESWIGKDPDLYVELYEDYLNKMSEIEKEIKIREDEIAIVVGQKDENGKVSKAGMQFYLDEKKIYIQTKLDFEKFIGSDWEEFSAFRREDKYSNDNYISDGLTNTELFSRAREFIDVAKNEIYKSAEMQKSISITMKNILAIERFEPLAESFEIGNWIRCMVDDDLYKLRLIKYDLSYDDITVLDVEFSTVTKIKDSFSDIESILDQASSMATSYDTVKRQVKNGDESKAILDDWVNNGLFLTNQKIVGNADNQNIMWDSHGILCREYLPELDEYDDRQLKIINRGIYITDDNWETAKTGIGNFNFYNPKTGQYEDAYGIIADKLVGNLILGKEVGIYNEEGSVTIDQHGVSITTYADNSQTQTAFTIQNKSKNDLGEDVITQLLYVDSDGQLVLNGTIRVNVPYDKDTSLGNLLDPANVDKKINDRMEYEKNPENKGSIGNIIDDTADTVLNEANNNLNNYKTEVGQYLTFGEEGLTIGAKGSAFKTVIDNRRLAFYDGDTAVSWISNNQLYINDAIINNSMFIGNFFFSPHGDGGVSLTWQNRPDIETVEEYIDDMNGGAVDG